MQTGINSLRRSISRIAGRKAFSMISTLACREKPKLAQLDSMTLLGIGTGDRSETWMNSKALEIFRIPQVCGLAEASA